jgi:hypothetical protein
VLTMMKNQDVEPVKAFQSKSFKQLGEVFRYDSY